MISVCMTTYNGEKYLEAQLQSILDQLTEEDELIVSDDGSSDATLGILESIRKKNVRVFRNHFRNPVRNFEFALAHSSRPLIALADQDDVWLPNKREVIVTNMAGASRKLLLMNGEIIDAGGRKTGQTTFEKWRSRSGFVANLMRNTFMGSSMAFTDDLKHLALPFPARIAMHDWWIGLLAEKAGEVHLVQDHTILYRIHGGNQSLQGSSTVEKLQWRFNMWNEVSRRIRERQQP